jgi:hypothetical protein
MRWFRVTVALGALGVMAQVANARTPAFVRQTGLTCNQCHMSINPAPDYTFTGMKFRLNGYRTPWVAEKVEAGTEGAVNGQRLLLTLGSALSFHARGTLLAQSTAPSDPTQPAPSAGTPNSAIIQTLALHYAGPIGEHVGIWDELYIYGGSAPGGNTHGYVGLNHYNLVYTSDVGGNILGMQLAGYSDGAHNFLAIMPDNTPNDQTRDDYGLAGSHAPYFLWDVYGFVSERVAFMVGVEPGEDNLDWKRFNYKWEAGVFPFNSDALFMMIRAEGKAGNDMVPIVSTNRAQNDGARTPAPADAVTGISATTASGAPYSSQSFGDGSRWLFSWSVGTIDRGPHSLTADLSAATETETYNDGGGAKMSSWGFETRYFYNRTYGVTLDASNYIKYNFTDYLGTVHDIPQDLSWSILLAWRLAQNYGMYFSYGNNQATVIDQNWRNGHSWSLNIQYLW